MGRSGPGGSVSQRPADPRVVASVQVAVGLGQWRSCQAELATDSSGRGRRGTAAARRAGRSRSPALTACQARDGVPDGMGTRRLLTLSHRAPKGAQPVERRKAARQRLWTPHLRTPRHSEALREGCCGYSRYSRGFSHYYRRRSTPLARRGTPGGVLSTRARVEGDFRPPAIYRVCIALLLLFIAHLAALDRPQRDEV